MIAWYGEQKLKDAAMNRLREHRRLDQLAQGFYFRNDEFRGCHLGCLTHRNEDSHEAAERMFAIPKRVGYWLEIVFENLPKDKCADWVIESTEAIPVGADLSMCHNHFLYWLLGPDSPSADGNDHPIVRDSVSQVRELHRLILSGESVTQEKWSAARSAAESAESAAAWSVISEKSIEIFSSAPVRQPTEDEECEQCVKDSLFLLTTGSTECRIRDQE